MAHWAQIDENNIVTQVTVGNNNDPDEGYQWLIDNLGGTWIQSSFNTYGGVHYTSDMVPSEDQSKALRYNYAAIGYTYDPDRDAFIAPKPHESWILNESTCIWEAPIAKPDDGQMYVWNEEAGNWELDSE